MKFTAQQGGTWQEPHFEKPQQQGMAVIDCTYVMRDWLGRQRLWHVQLACVACATVVCKPGHLGLNCHRSVPGSWAWFTRKDVIRLNSDAPCHDAVIAKRSARALAPCLCLATALLFSCLVDSTKLLWHCWLESCYLQRLASHQAGK